MRRFKLAVLGVVLAVSACATNLIGKETQAQQAVNATLSMANARFMQGKISRDSHAKILLWADAATAGIKAAVAAGDGASLEATTADATVKLTEVTK